KVIGHLPEGWESMSIADLENQKMERSSNWSLIETSVFLRVAAIIFVVISHSGLTAVGGGTHVLTMLVGSNFARFQLGELSRGHPWNVIARYAWKILIPYYILAVVFWLWTGNLDPSIFFMYQNMVGVHWTIAFPFWFVQVIMQCLLIVAIMFSIPVLRSKIKDNPWLVSFVML